MNPAQTLSTDEFTLHSLADVTERMIARFRNRIDMPTIALVVRRCSRELSVTRHPVSLDAVAHLAAHRLTDVAKRAEPSQL